MKIIIVLIAITLLFPFATMAQGMKKTYEVKITCYPIEFVIMMSTKMGEALTDNLPLPDGDDIHLYKGEDKAYSVFWVNYKTNAACYIGGVVATEDKKT